MGRFSQDFFLKKVAGKETGCIYPYISCIQWDRAVVFPKIIFIYILWVKWAKICLACWWD